ncbi:hypothetical protein G6F24_008300 [Rhizopus arrhizus]|nr:hypothetical protein G6F24_008300 [Rhizopus arrhizus]
MPPCWPSCSQLQTPCWPSANAANTPGGLSDEPQERRETRSQIHVRRYAAVDPRMAADQGQQWLHPRPVAHAAQPAVPGVWARCDAPACRFPT